MSRAWSILGVLLVSVTMAAAQQQPVPQPFPRPGERPPARPGDEPQAPAEARGAEDEEDVVEVDDRPIVLPELRRPAAAGPRPGSEAAPSEEMLGLPIYPTAQFITSYDAGADQRFYLFGTTASFGEMLAYYSTRLRQRGSRVFAAPPTHAFEVGRFRQDSMAFPPGVTIKDYTWGHFEGYLNPVPGAEPRRFPTIIQIVAVPPEDR